jgi:hypothetical protein
MSKRSFAFVVASLLFVPIGAYAQSGGGGGGDGAGRPGQQEGKEYLQRLLSAFLG